MLKLFIIISRGKKIIRRDRIGRRISGARKNYGMSNIERKKNWRKDKKSRRRIIRIKENYIQKKKTNRSNNNKES